MSSACGVLLLDEARERGARVTSETCPHYLTLEAKEVPVAATQFKCAPPIRCSQNRNELWKCLQKGSINMVVSDHSPCTPELKTNDFLKAWGGISSLQFGMSLVWTEGSVRGLSLPQLSRLMSAAPAELCSLQERKGAIREGLDADLIVFDPDQTYTVTKECILYKNKVCPYMGRELKGRVLKTFLRGQLVYSLSDDGNGGTFSDQPLGKLLLK